MASIFLQVLLPATVVAFIAVGCGNRSFNPPSDEDMIRNFYAHEDAFNEITEILLNCPYGDIYPPFYPIGSATDSLCLASLGNEKCTRLDSLLASVGGRDVCKGRKSLLFCEVFFDIFSGCFTYHGCNLFQ